MTLGERVQIPEKLDTRLAPTLLERMPFHRRRVLGKNGIQLLHSLSKDRNLFVHHTNSLDGSPISESLARVAEFCNLDLVTAAIAIQEARTNNRL